MNQEEQSIILEMNETMIDRYRELAARIATASIAHGYPIPRQSTESAYNAQAQVARLAVVLIDDVFPILDKQLAGLNDQDQDELLDLCSALQNAVSMAATANGLPACQYYRHPTDEEMDSLIQQGDDAA